MSRVRKQRVAVTPGAGPRGTSRSAEQRRKPPVERDNSRSRRVRKSAKNASNEREGRGGPRQRRARSRKKSSDATLAIARFVSLSVLVVMVGILLVWRIFAGEPMTSRQAWSQFRGFEVARGATTTDVAKALLSEGLADDPSRFVWSQRLLGVGTSIDEGGHWLPVGATTQELRSLLTRRSSTSERVTIPEGWDSFQLAERLGQRGVCEPGAFLKVVFDEDIAQRLVEQPSLEGYLYPDTYEFKHNSRPQLVAERLVRTAQARFDDVFSANVAALHRLTSLGLDRAGVVKLASIVEKEAAGGNEFPLVASVFLNRLRDTSFLPRRMLQSDPTAGYGCKLPGAPVSCAMYKGRILPSMLRDTTNRYNTYKHAGLPPTSIGNPSAAGVGAVLNAPKTAFLYFVTKRGGGHHFSATYQEHLKATKSSPR